jgi:hypothetical protein
VASLRWAGGAPRLLVVERDAAAPGLTLVELDPAAGTRMRLGAVPEADGLPWTAAWAADGRRAALWVPVATASEAQSCPPGSICTGRRLVHWRLYLWDASSAAAAVLAEMVSSEGAAWLAFSPDAARVAYVLGGSLYTQPVTARPDSR